MGCPGARIARFWGELVSIMRWQTWRRFCLTCEIDGLESMGDRRDSEAEAKADEKQHEIDVHKSDDSGATS